MKPRSFVTISLLTVVLLAGCVPASAPVPAQPDVSTQPVMPVDEATATHQPPVSVEASPITSEILPTQTPTESPQAIATSRGPDLEATDPATVNLASGELQLVEFFRFT